MAKSKINSHVIRTPITFSRFVLLLFLAGYSLSGWLRFSQTISNRAWIDSMRLGPGTDYFTISGLVWGSLFLAAFLAVLLQLKAAGWFTIGVALIASTWHWFERLAFARSPLVNSGWLFEVIFNVGLLVVLFLMMKGFPPSYANE